MPAHTYTRAIATVFEATAPAATITIETSAINRMDSNA